MLLLWPTPAARAQETCGLPFREHELRSLVEQSHAVILRDDVIAHQRLWDEAIARLPCFDGQLPKDAWAELLVDQAIVAKVSGRPWNELLDTALRVHPALDEVPRYLQAEYAPGRPPEGSGQVLPRSATLFVDGVLTPRAPVITGLHVAQLWRDGAWRTAVLDSQPIPDAWLVPDAPDNVIVAAPEAPQPKPRLAFGAVVGPILGRQMTQDPREWIGNSEQYALWTTFVTDGVVPVAGPAGAWWKASLPLQVFSVRQRADGDWAVDPFSALPSAWLGASGSTDEITVGMGAGFFTLLHWQGDEVRALAYPQPDVRLIVARGGREVEIDAGLTPAAMHAGLYAGLVTVSTRKGDDRNVGVRLGADANLGVAWLTEEPPGERQATALAAGLGFRLDAVVGHDR